jgi:hypothetical protein
LRAGFNHHLTKPVSFDKLGDILSEVQRKVEAEVEVQVEEPRQSDVVVQ